MRRFLVVGCGGSGGATLAYMMDHLRNALAEKGYVLPPDRMPAGWEFVHVDVPVATDSAPEGLAPVAKQGGRYLATGSTTTLTYEQVDAELCKKVQTRGSRALEGLEGWVPRLPGNVTVAVSLGAGQYRAVGRAITLNRSLAVFDGLKAAWQRLQQPEVTTELSAVAAAFDQTYAAEPSPIVLVVSSMAGGAGASMALDVCRLIQRIPGVDSQTTGVFMLSADVFDEITPAMRVGVRPNSLAMIGEIAAAQNGTAGEHDSNVLEGIGAGAGGNGAPFQRVIPIGRYIGGDGATLGQGTMRDVYRALGRGIGALMVSGRSALQDFVAYDLVNTTPLTIDWQQSGWGVPHSGALTMAGFGFANLSMGRDRYAEYSAQRLARAAVDRLVEGHMRPGSSASSTEAIAAMLEHLWPQAVAQLKLPTTPQQITGWLDAVVLGGQAGTQVRAAVDLKVRSGLAGGDGHVATQWVPLVRQQLAQQRSAVSEAARQVAYRAAWDWHQDLRERAEDVISEAVSTLGLPYAQALVTRIRQHVDRVVIPALAPLAAYASGDAVALGQDIDATLGGLKGVLANSAAVVERVLDAVRGSALLVARGSAAELAATVLASFSPQVLDPLAEAAANVLAGLERARTEDPSGLGLAVLETDVYSAWPNEREATPARFSHAENEVLVTDAGDFPAQYVAHLSAAVPGQAGYADALGLAVGQVISGVWVTSGGTRPPGGLLAQHGSWICPAFPVDPDAGQARVPSAARYAFATTPKAVLERSRGFIARPAESFRSFTQVGLGTYLTETGVPEHVLDDRRRTVLAKFRETLALARPLVGVNAEAVSALHGVDLKYRYKFSAVPFQGVIDGQIRELLSDPSIDPSSLANFGAGLAPASSPAQQVSVFGSYQHYVPIAFRSIFQPIADQWAQTTAQGRPAFWEYRRSRPLTAALPFSEPERRAIVAGWYTAQICGTLSVPKPPGLHLPVPDEPVRLYSDESQSWLAFPHPLLSPPGSPGFEPLGWLPAVLEGVLLAQARASEPPVLGSLRPYVALRRQWDRGLQGPTLGPTLHAVQAVASWLATGAVPAGGSSAITAEATTPAERAEAAVAWVHAFAEYVGAEYLPPAPGATTGGGRFAVIDTREKVGAAPLVREVAADIFWAMGELERVIGLALEVVNATSTSSSRLPEGVV